MQDICEQLSRCTVKTRLSLTGTLVVGRDIAHAKIKERLDAGEPMPEYMKNHPVYYAGPAKTPDVRRLECRGGITCVYLHYKLPITPTPVQGYSSGSFGPTTAGRMDAYVDCFQAAGGSMVMLAKG